MNNYKNNIYFSDFFSVSHEQIEEYGALDASLICDNPAFVDPFLIFANEKYSRLHEFIIRYLRYLKDLTIKNANTTLDNGEYNQYYKFSEVKQAWLGYSISGNDGLGLGKDFGDSLYKNLHKIFSGFGSEKITESSHLEKLCLIEEGIGIDKISDFTLNLIKKYLLDYTEEFALKFIDKKHIKEFAVNKVVFNFEKGFWEGRKYNLPFLQHTLKRDFVLLIPKDILAKEETWISRSDFLNNDASIFKTIENDELRSKINKYFYNALSTKVSKSGEESKDESKKSRKAALQKTLYAYPELIDYYIKSKELNKEEALEKHIADPEGINFHFDTTTIQLIIGKKQYGKLTSLDDCIERIKFFKHTVESNSNALYMKDKHLQEKQLQLMFRLTTNNSLFDYNSEVNNGRGPIDFIISYGSQDKVGLELKLASSTKLKKNLMNQSEIYAVDSNLKHVICVIFYFSDKELDRAIEILKIVGKTVDNNNIFLIDCRKKESASNQ